MTSFVKKRGNSWTYYFEPIVNGKKKQISRGGFRTKSEAKSALAQAVIDFEERGFLGNNKTRLDAFFEDWLENNVRETKSHTTYLRYKGLYDRYIRDQIGGEYLSAITPIRVEHTLRAARKTGISETSVQHIYVLLHSILQRAERLRLIKDNPCDYVDRPKRERTHTEVLTEEDVGAILAVLDLRKPGDRIFHTGFLFAFIYRDYHAFCVMRCMLDDSKFTCLDLFGVHVSICYWIKREISSASAISCCVLPANSRACFNVKPNLPHLLAVYFTLLIVECQELSVES